jgi:hypothetical protein
MGGFLDDFRLESIERDLIIFTLFTNVILQVIFEALITGGNGKLKIG